MPPPFTNFPIPTVDFNTLVGSSTVTATGGSTARTLADRFADTKWIEDFGAVGDGVTDDSAAVVAAYTALGARGGIIRLHAKKYLFDTGFTLPFGVVIQGEFVSPFEWSEFDGAFGDRNTVVYLNPTQTYNVSDYGGWIHCCILKKGVVAPTNQAQATALVNSFAGTAITVSGRDITLYRLCIGGFNRAIDWNNVNLDQSRPRFSEIFFDCTNGIRVGVMGDIGDISFLRGFPFLTGDPTLAQTPPFTFQYRTGIAFEATGVWDWGTIRWAVFFGWLTGFKINNCNNTDLFLCANDGPLALFKSQSLFPVGVLYTGTCDQATLTNCRFPAQSTAIKSSVSTGGLVKVINCQTWGTDHMFEITGNGRVLMQGCDMSFDTGAGQTPQITLGASAGKSTIYGNSFTETGGAPTNDFMSVNAAVDLTYWGNTFLNCHPNYPEGFSATTKGFGYKQGAGGTVTQATSKATAVTLNKLSGNIVMNGAALNADTTVNFTLNNSYIETDNLLVTNHISGGTVGSYLINSQCASGSALISVRNITPGNLTESPVIQFAVIKAATS